MTKSGKRIALCGIAVLTVVVLSIIFVCICHLNVLGGKDALGSFFPALGDGFKYGTNGWGVAAGFTTLGAIFFGLLYCIVGNICFKKYYEKPLPGVVIDGTLPGVVTLTGVV